MTFRYKEILTVPCSELTRHKYKYVSNGIASNYRQMAIRNIDHNQRSVYRALNYFIATLNYLLDVESTLEELSKR